MKISFRDIWSAKGGIIPGILIYLVLVVIVATFSGYYFSSLGKDTFFSGFITTIIMGVAVLVIIPLEPLARKLGEQIGRIFEREK